MPGKLQSHFLFSRIGLIDGPPSWMNLSSATAVLLHTHQFRKGEIVASLRRAY
jgi:hypothetical protein